MPSSGSVEPATSFKQRRLAGAVDAHHAPALPAAHLEVQPVIDAPAAVALLHLLQAHHVLARARRGQEFELHDLAALRRFHPLDLVQLLHPALHLRRVRGARLEAFDELDLLGQHRLLALELRLLLLVAQRALLLVELVIAGIGRELTAVDLHHLVDDAVHELAVVRGHQQRALVTFKELLQPDQAFEIQMVAGLVQQHGVGTHQKDAGQRHPHLPAADNAPTSPSIISWLKLRPAKHLARPALQRVAVQFLEPCLHLAVARDDLVHVIGSVSVSHGGLELSQLGRHGADRTGAVHHLGDGAAAGHLADVLAEIPDGDAAIDGDLAFVGLLLAGDHPEQSGLAGAIGADEADLFALLERRRSLDEEDLVADLLADIVETNYGYGALQRKLRPLLCHAARRRKSYEADRITDKPPRYPTPPARAALPSRTGAPRCRRRHSAAFRNRPSPRPSALRG